VGGGDIVVSGNIDERIVEMKFQGESFASEVKNIVEALTNLKNGLNNLKGGEKDINSLDDAGKKFSLSGMSNGIASAAHHFGLLRIAGLTAFTSLVRQGLYAGERIVAAFTIDPIKAGLDVYETKINAIKTILANTQSEGTNLKQVTAALSQLNTYANLTVYNFGEMARNIGTFTAAGVGLKTSVASIKGIANLAALSGSNSEQASTAMYQLSQAIASGTVKLQDWNSVVNAGLGGKVFQHALETTAKATGVNIDAIIKKAGSFRNSLQKGWLSAKILTETLSTFTGDLSAKQLKAMGFTNSETEAIMKQAQAAVSSATQIRTITQLMQALKEEVATAWSKVWEALVGNIGQATTTLSALHQTLENFFTKPVYDLAKYLQQWNDLGGRAKLIDAFTNGFKFLASIMHVVGSAFREVFPSSAGNTLFTLTTAIDNFTKHLKLSSQGAQEVKTIFEGVFSVFKIVLDLIGDLAGGFTKIGGATVHASGGFLSLIALVASWINNLRKAVESGNALARFFTFLGTVLSLPIKAIGLLINFLSSLGSHAAQAADAAGSFVDKIGSVFSRLGQAIADGIKNGNFNAIVGVINQVLLGGVLLSIRKFISNISKGGEGKPGLFDTIKESFESLTNSLKTLQANLKAGILQKIAIAIALLAASLLVLSLINVKDLTKSLAAMTVMFTQLISAMAIITKIGGTTGIVKMGAIVLALNLLAVAIVTLSVAVAILSRFSWEQLAKGLSAIAILLIELNTAVALMSKDSKGTLASAYAMEVMATAMNVMSFAVGRLGKMPIGNLAKGVGSIAVLLAILAGFNKISGVQLVGTATSMVILGAALLVISKAVETLGALSVASLAKGILGVAGALVVISGAMYLFPPSMLATATGLLLVSVALEILSKALVTMGGMSWGAIGKSLVVLAGALVVIAAAMALMTGALPGAAALLIVSAALAILAPVLATLGSLSWESIAKGLVALAAVFVILGAAGLLLAPVAPILLAIGAAVALFGGGLLAIAAAVGLFAAGIAAMSVAVIAAGAAIASFIKSIISIGPAVISNIGLTISTIAKTVETVGKAIIAAFVGLLDGILDAITKVVGKVATAFNAVMAAVLSVVKVGAPRVLDAFLTMLLDIVQKIASYVPKFISAGTNLVVGIINGVSRSLGRVISAGVNLVISFVNAIGNGIGRVVSAGVNMVINLVNGIANKIRSSGPALHSAAANLGAAIVEGMISGISGLAGGVISAVENMASGALHKALSFLHINSPSKVFRKQVGAAIPEGTALGVRENTSLVTDEITAMGTALLSAVGKTMAALNDTINDNMDLQPTITPVIDLTAAKKGLGDLAGITKSQLIAATVSSTSAASISASNAAAAAAAGLTALGATNLTFNQTNVSPKALSATDIYRKTKNQISIAKGVLNANSSGSNK
jgi:tape measure domain-containing protein